MSSITPGCDDSRIPRLDSHLYAKCECRSVIAARSPAKCHSLRRVLYPPMGFRVSSDCSRVRLPVPRPRPRAQGRVLLHRAAHRWWCAAAVRARAVRARVCGARQLPFPPVRRLPQSHCRGAHGGVLPLLSRRPAIRDVRPD